MSGVDEEREAQEVGLSRLFVVTQVERSWNGNPDTQTDTGSRWICYWLSQSLL